MISKTTINMAAKRGISIEQMTDTILVFDGIFKLPENEEMEVVEISRLEDGEPADEYAALYRVGDDGLYYLNSCTGQGEEFPYWIPSDKSLRGLLDQMSKCINPTI